MKRGDIVGYKKSFRHPFVGLDNKTWIVRRTEPNNNWVFVFGMDVPLQESLLEVVSAAPR